MQKARKNKDYNTHNDHQCLNNEKEPVMACKKKAKPTPKKK